MSYRGWGLNSPSIEINTVLFSDVFQEGEQILTVKYYSKLKMYKMIKINDMKLISFENIEEIRNNLSDFYNRLGVDANGIKGKDVYEEKINEEKILTANNYYLIKKRDQGNSYIILILDINDKKLYKFITVQ